MPLDAGFLEMLTATCIWEGNNGQDVWGNEQYSPPITLCCFVTNQTSDFGTDDGQERQENVRVTSMTIITDAVGVGLKDRFNVSGRILYVDHVDTPKDEYGVDLMHTITATSTERG